MAAGTPEIRATTFHYGCELPCVWRGRAPTYNVVTFHVYRAIAHRFGSVFSHLAGNRITRAILFWLFFGRPWVIPKAAAIEASNAFANAPGFDAILSATSRERFHGGSAIDVPISIVWGARDVFLLPWQSRFRDELPLRARWSILDCCGHVPTFDDPHAVASVILGTTAWALDEQRREVK